MPTPTFVQLSPTPMPIGTSTLLPSSTVVVRPTLPGVASPPTRITPLPTALPSPVLPSGCVVGQLISNPQPGSTLTRGEIVVAGTANLQPFQRYKLEWASGWDAFDHAYEVIVEVSEPVVNGVLYRWMTQQLTSGDYSLRLTIVRPDGNWFEPRCIITFTLK